MSGGACWPKVRPQLIADQASPEHTRNVIAEAQRDIAMMTDALERAEAFIAGFEGDPTQDHVEELLAKVRAAAARGRGE